MDIAKTIQAIEILFGILKDQLGQQPDPDARRDPMLTAGGNAVNIKPKRKYKKRKETKREEPEDDDDDDDDDDNDNDDDVEEAEESEKPKKKWAWSEERRRRFNEARKAHQERSDVGRIIDNVMHCNSCGKDFVWNGPVLDAYCTECESGAVVEKKDAID